MKKWNLRKQLLWLVVATILVAALGACLGFDRRRDILRNSTKFEIPAGVGDVGLNPRWMTGGIFLLTCYTNHNTTGILYDPVKGSQASIPNISDSLSKYGSNKWAVYAHSNWIVLDSIWDPNQTSLPNISNAVSKNVPDNRHGYRRTNWVALNSISDSNFVSLSFDVSNFSTFTNMSNWRSWGDLFWMPSGLGWLRISGYNYRIEQPNGVREINVNKGFNPRFPIGFISDDVFVSATNDLDASCDAVLPYPKTLNLEYWHLDENPTLLATKKIYINGDYIINGVVSQQGDRILWICYHKRLFPHFTQSKGLLASRYDIKLYVSSNNADQIRYIGAFPSTTHFPHAQWLPDGTGIYFEYDRSWYIYHF